MTVEEKIFKKTVRLPYVNKQGYSLIYENYPYSTKIQCKEYSFFTTNEFTYTRLPLGLDTRH